jgi:hypothetical protein
MKKLIVLICLAVASVTIFYSCKKENSKPTPAPISVEQKFDIEKSELKSILADLNSEEKTLRDWWDRVVKWVKSHIGISQIYINGQPTCGGTHPCGPCPGMCLNSALVAGGENGDISQDDLNLGLRPLLFTIIEKKADPSKHKLLIEIPLNYVNDFIMNESFRVDNDANLPEFIVTELGATSITVKAGLYPTVINEETGNTVTIVNITVVK